LVGALIAVVVCMVLFAIIMLSGGADEWVPARAEGEWTATTVVYAPQVVAHERWDGDCVNDPNGSVRPGTCVLRDTQAYHDTVIDDYEEYAYNIHHEETWDRLYQAQGTEFVATTLDTDEWWEGRLHYSRVEELDRETCEYTKYTVWVDDRQDSSQEVEVYLSECEVWDHVTVTERTYDQAMWCLCDVTSLVQIGQQVGKGTGTSVVWPEPSLPAGGRTEQHFSGTVTFVGEDHEFTATSEDLDQYLDYLTSRHYIGLDDGRPVAVSKTPPDR
jgi:hypothetical protein